MGELTATTCVSRNPIMKSCVQFSMVCARRLFDSLSSSGTPWRLAVFSVGASGASLLACRHPCISAVLSPAAAPVTSRLPVEG